jgi:hypothetical protein
MRRIARKPVANRELTGGRRRSGAAAASFVRGVMGGLDELARAAFELGGAFLVDPGEGLEPLGDLLGDDLGREAAALARVIAELLRLRLLRRRIKGWGLIHVMFQALGCRIRSSRCGGGSREVSDWSNGRAKENAK